MGLLDSLKSYGSGLLNNFIGPEYASTEGKNLGVVPGQAATPDYGTSPGLQPVAQQTAGVQQASLPDAGQTLTAAPTAEKQGLLSRMGTPDASGLNFSDKLFALGQILQGDTPGAGAYLQQQRANADVLAQRAQQQKIAQAGLDALRNNINPDGSINWKGYLAALPAGADPTDAVKLSQGMRTKYDYMNTSGGGIAAVNPYDKNDFTQLVKGTPGLINPDGTINQDVLAAQALQKKTLAAAQREGAPPVGRSGGGKAAKPKSWGANEVTWQ